MSEPQQLAPLQDRLSSRQIDKLDLEIDNLRVKNKWEPYLQFIPLVTAFVAVIGFLWGVYKFQKERSLQLNQSIIEQQRDRITREVDQRLRIQNQIRADVDEILRFTHDKNQTLSRVTFLLEDLNTVMASPINDRQKASDIFAGYKRTFTSSLVDLIAEEVDFMKNPKDVRFAAIAIEGWDDYGVYLKQHLNRLNFILYKYVRALRYLRDKNPLYFQEMTYEEQTDEYFVPPKYERREGEEELFEHFSDIRDGFKDHIELIAEDLGPEAQKIRDRSLREFQAALCNPAISKHILGVDFPEEPCQK